MSETPAETPSTPAATPVVEAPLESKGKVYDEAYVKELRDEAAAARIAKKTAVEEAESALKTAHSQELADRDTAYAALQNELGSAWIELEKVYTAVEAKVPSDRVRAFVDILEGTDKDTIAESVKTRLDLFGGFEEKQRQIPAYDPSQGRGGKPPIPLNGDPILGAIKSALKIP